MRRFIIMGILAIVSLSLSITASGRHSSAPEGKAIKFVKEGAIDLIATVPEQTCVAYKEPVKTAPAVAAVPFFNDALSFVQPLCRAKLYVDSMRRQVAQKNKGPTDKNYTELGNSIAYMRG